MQGEYQFKLTATLVNVSDHLDFKWPPISEANYSSSIWVNLSISDCPKNLTSDQTTFKFSYKILEDTVEDHSFKVATVKLTTPCEYLYVAETTLSWLNATLRGKVTEHQVWKDAIRFESSKNSVVFKGVHDLPKLGEFELEYRFNDSAKTSKKFYFLVERINELKKVDSEEANKQISQATLSTEKPSLRETMELIRIKANESMTIALPGVNPILNLDGSHQ